MKPRLGLLGGVATLTALAALWLLHRQPQPATALLCGGLGLGTAVLLRGAWARLPGFVTGWLDAGTAVVVALIGATVTGLTHGPAYVVLRSTEIAALIAGTGLAGTAVASLAYTHHRLALEVEHRAHRVALLQQHALQSRLAALSAQINPHFLFNTLNTIAEVVHEDEDLADDLITDLAGMMRYALRSSASRASLAEELDTVRRLLRIESARLGERLSWSVELEPGAAGVELPGLLVQALVENAVRHGVAPQPGGGSVWVEARCVDEQVQIEVRDDGPGLPQGLAEQLDQPGRGTAGAGGGLYNTAERIRLSWPAGSASLSVVPSPRGTTLRLEIPRS